MNQAITFVSLCFILCISCGKKNSDGDKKMNIADIRQVSGIGRVDSKEEILSLSADVGGIISTIFKQENDLLTKGEVILELDHTIEDAKLALAAGNIMTQKAQIISDIASLHQAKAKATNTGLEVARLSKLLKDGAETQQTLDNANTNLMVLNSDVARMEALLSVSRFKLVSLEKELDLAQAERNKKIIKTPVDGKLIELTTRPGESLNAYQSFATIMPQSDLIVLVEIDELFADKVKQGQKAIIKDPNTDKEITTGTVYFVSSELRNKSLFLNTSGEMIDRRVRKVKVSIDNATGLLLNSQVECYIKVRE